MSSPRAKPGRFALFENRDFRFHQVARFLSIFGLQMLAVAVGWQIYELTKDPLALGLAGLAQFLPPIGFAIITGHVADRFDRRAILVVCQAAYCLACVLLFLNARSGHVAVAPMYAILFLLGTARAFSGPAAQALLPHIVAKEQFPMAVAIASSVFEIATIAGPAVGGILLGTSVGVEGVYLASSACTFGSLAALLALRVRTGRMETGAASWSSLLAGVRYVWEKKIILGTISLDLFAVLLGGAVALLPVFVRDILHAGPRELGLLRASPAIGALLVALFLTVRPIGRRAGRLMLLCVALFGAATIVFGVSTSLPLSMAALVVAGAADMVSVVVRLTVVQINTPPEMRGRVSAVNLVFVGASNELGEFESGVTAAWLGTVPSVVIGGIGTLLVVALWARLFPALRRIDRLDAVESKAA